MRISLAPLITVLNQKLLFFTHSVECAGDYGRSIRLRYFPLLQVIDNWTTGASVLKEDGTRAYRCGRCEMEVR